MQATVSQLVISLATSELSEQPAHQWRDQPPRSFALGCGASRSLDPHCQQNALRGLRWGLLAGSTGSATFENLSYVMPTSFRISAAFAATARSVTAIACSSSTAPSTTNSDCIVSAQTNAIYLRRVCAQACSASGSVSVCRVSVMTSDQADGRSDLGPSQSRAGRELNAPFR